MLSQDVIPTMVDHCNLRYTRDAVAEVRSDLDRLAQHDDPLEARLSSLRTSLYHVREINRERQQLSLVRNSFDGVKLEYISQNYVRVAAFLIILFLPGIFVSVSITDLARCLFETNCRIDADREPCHSNLVSTLNLLARDSDTRDVRYYWVALCHVLFSWPHFGCSIVLRASPGVSERHSVTPSE